jgi:hypothetical protein
MNEPHRTKVGDKVWIIEEDGSHVPATYLGASVWPGQAYVEADEDYAASNGYQVGRRLWAKRNLIDHESVERVR